MVRTEILVRQGADVVVDESSSTRYQIASVSKQFTAAAVLMLVEQEVLGLDDRLEQWVGGWPDEWRGITLHQLLTHTSGIGHWEDYPRIDPAVRVEPDELLDHFRRRPLLFVPGDGWHYSSPAYVLLAHIVQRAADLPYRDFLADRFFGPFGLSRTFAGSPTDETEVAGGHDAQGQPLPSWELDVVGMGAGDVWSTAADLIDWLDALEDGRVLGEPYRTLMLGERVRIGGKDPETSGYGYGVFTGEVAGRSWWYHSGHNPGFKAYAGSIPSTGRRLVVLSNTEATDARVLADLVGS
ncbi:CubicO group peptidase (beta-lactamase class C family) [Actinoplanes lutulentus]|uniref:CubicO group peptidase (Beta-lactamase class C family) n=1 Tax=Actinoplanes lutulentus TaxID=1287878 RepID=A0A327ZGZ7_9ACTN|nr:serine hydrolase domain-containing protein [Actinoplanes lutulentus]MBB2944574.1 CubicO group peptidase (beta-lactamase class C family) [Actinoplanes lutulentus]RAK42197.1 CubicO group peptidase (beta-lactamase class C family) [Actinoplanes lutulentus]